ncbi:MAG TPA: virulence-associated E family protein [Bryobacteraceae bacterium]|jgi:predicted P-loop ATPase|nr:virulence-associated E family protein [Bryobacteraceae bacterium]
MNDAAARLIPAVREVIDIGLAWRSQLPVLSDRGEPRPVFANALAALRTAPAWADVVARDIFAFRTVAVKATPWGHTGPWSEPQDAVTCDWLQRHGILVSIDIAARAIETVAEDNPIHPVREYLDALKWDARPRLNKLFTFYAGAADTDYSSAVGCRWAISAIARIRKPGCKADHVPILENPQGTLKSSFCRVLGGQFFSDEIAELGTKDASMGVASAWIIELGELDAFGRAEQSRLKAFLSRSTDRFRPPYGRRIIEAPRQSVFIGTTNLAAYLKDETGARRFWPVRCGEIRIDVLQRDRDQLWAEAQHRFDAGEPWWIDDSALVAEASSEQRARYETDPWEPLIEKWSVAHATVSVEQVLMVCLEKPKAQWTQADKNRIARCLQAQGWERFQRRTGDGREWLYRRKSIDVTSLSPAEHGKW